MAKKLLLLAAVIAVALIVAVVGIVVLYPAMQPQSIQPQSTQPQDASEILQSSKNAVENLESFKADAYFYQSSDSDYLKVLSRYSMQLELLSSEEG
ncbi:MAG: hypothetical protein U9O85_03670, partial [Euryarchaeota archaeon]|nr:hypothetical protein [Euryarchaeota archaeon]